VLLEAALVPYLRRKGENLAEGDVTELKNGGESFADNTCLNDGKPSRRRHPLNWREFKISRSDLQTSEVGTSSQSSWILCELLADRQSADG